MYKKVLTKYKCGFYFLIFLILPLSVFYFYGKDHHYFSSTPRSAQKLAAKQLAFSALSSQGIWDQEFLTQHKAIQDKIIQFEQGTLCKGLKQLDTKSLTHQQLLHQIKRKGFSCFVRPLSSKPTASSQTYLKIDGTVTKNPQESGVAYQEICYKRAQPECVIRFKRDGFPLNRRSNPHSTKSVLIDAQGDPADYENEAFKIGVKGQVIPRGPSEKMGLRKCPASWKKSFCDHWIDAIMEVAHPSLKEPVRTPLNP